MISIYTLIVSPFQQNCRIITYKGKAIIVDPGDQADDIIQFLSNKNVVCEAVFITHSHIDHVGALADLLKLLSERSHKTVNVYGHKLGKLMRSSIELLAQHYGLSGFKNAPEPNRYIQGAEQISVIGLTIDVIFTPGHSPDHVVYFLQPESSVNLQDEFSTETTQDPILIGGDCLFRGSIGRTDLPGGNHDQLIESIKTKLFVLPQNTRVLSGHGPITSIAIEQASNPFLK